MKFDRATYLVFGMAMMCLFLTVVAATASAENSGPGITAISAPATGATADAAREVIRRQLQAIKVRDADTAFSLTTPGNHKKYDGSAAAFLTKMRYSYRPIYNHQTITFLDRHDIKGALIQKVRIENRRSEPVTVIYRLEQQAEDGPWLIDSFTILASESEPI